ncbi:MAG: hypothetical protein MRZ89_03400 [Lachnospiraceae bacterium]|nr:hypothetical protein [Lachnospiraceae bacterium]
MARLFNGYHEKSNNNPMDGYFDLLAEVYKITANDYKNALIVLKKCPTNEHALSTKYVCEKFFKNNPYEIGIDGELIMSEIERQIKSDNESVSKKQKKLLELVFDQNLNNNEISEQIGLTQNRVGCLLRQYGIKRGT